MNVDETLHPRLLHELGRWEGSILNECREIFRKAMEPLPEAERAMAVPFFESLAQQIPPKILGGGGGFLKLLSDWLYQQDLLNAPTTKRMQ
jgi:hypothetical protein